MPGDIIHGIDDWNDQRIIKRDIKKLHNKLFNPKGLHIKSCDLYQNSGANTMKTKYWNNQYSNGFRKYT